MRRAQPLNDTRDALDETRQDQPAVFPPRATERGDVGAIARDLMGRLSKTLERLAK